MRVIELYNKMRKLKEEAFNINRLQKDIDSYFEWGQKQNEINKTEKEIMDILGSKVYKLPSGRYLTQNDGLRLLECEEYIESNS